MDHEDPSEWAKLAIRLAAVPGEVVATAKGYPTLVSMGALMLEAAIPERKRDGEEFAGVVAAVVGPERLERIIKSDDERREMLWTGVQAAMATGIEGKRVLMARVVANAMTSEEPIDDEQLMLWALAELEAPHFRALMQIKHGDAENQKAPQYDDEPLQKVLRGQRYPVLATLARTGVVRQGSEERGSGMWSITFAETLGITGISDFGLKLLADLESVNTEL